MVVGTVAAAATLVAIPVLTAEVASEVTLVAPPPLAIAEEERETELPASLGGGQHGSPSWSEPKAQEGDAIGIESERPSMARETKVVDILSDDEADDVVELPMPSRELAVVWLEARPSSSPKETSLEWPFPEDPTKVRFVLQDS